MELDELCRAADGRPPSGSSAPGRCDLAAPFTQPNRGTLDRVGRLIAVVLFIAVLVPGVLLARAWWLAAGRRAVAGRGGRARRADRRGHADAAPAGAARTPGAPARPAPRRGRRDRAASSCCAEASVFLWVPALVLGLLAGVLLAEATRPRPRWKLAVPARRPRRSEQISGWLVWTMRVAVAAQVAADGLALARGRAHRRRGLGRAGRARSPPGCWPRSPCCAPWSARCRRRAPTSRSTRRCAPGRRTWSPPRPPCWRCCRWAPCCCAPGSTRTGSREGYDFLPVALVAAGFSALAAGLAVAGFLLTWLRPVRSNARALAGLSGPPRRAGCPGARTLWPSSPGPASHSSPVPRVSPGTSVTEGVGAPTIRT